MTNNEFSNLNPVLGDYKINTRGENISEGYRPDLTIKSKSSTIFIFENEKGSSRKQFLGGLVKAVKYAANNKIEAALTFVIEENKKITIQNISKHLEPYFTWIVSSLGENNYLKKIFFMKDSEYIKAIKENIVICSDSFYQRGILINSNKD